MPRARPATAAQLRAVPGIGADKVRKRLLSTAGLNVEKMNLNTTLTISPQGELHLQMGNGIFDETVQLDDWAPGADWQIALGASCSNGCAAPENAQWVDNLLVRSDALVQTASVELCLAVN